MAGSDRTWSEDASFFAYLKQMVMYILGRSEIEPEGPIDKLKAFLYNFFQREKEAVTTVFQSPKDASFHGLAIVGLALAFIAISIKKFKKF